MRAIVRMYEREDQARRAAAELTAGFLYESDVHVLAPAPGDEARAVDAAIRERRLPGRVRNGALAGMRRGRFLVTAAAPVGYALLVAEALDRHGPVDTATLPEYEPRDPAPFSSLLGLPVLLEGKSHAVLASNKTFTPGLLSARATPLSSLFGLPVLGGAKPPWRSSLGLPLLSSRAAPLSSALGLPTLTAPKRAWTRSFGLPLLSRNATPLSGLLGLPVLTRRTR